MTHQKNASNIHSNSKVWFITGCSRGFGKIWTDAILKRGDKVVATARDLQKILPLKETYGDQVLPLTLDITKSDQITKAVEAALKYFGKIDIVLNNAGYGLISTVEEANSEDLKALYATNVMGPHSLLKAILPYFRKQQSGHVLGVSSGLGHLCQPLIGHYCATKWAFEAMHESLSMEVASMGIKVTILEPGAYKTDFGTDASLQSASQIPDYEHVRRQTIEGLHNMDLGDPYVTPKALFAVVDAPDPPLRLNLGNQNLPEIQRAYEQRLTLWKKWAYLSNSVQN